MRLDGDTVEQMSVTPLCLDPPEVMSLVHTLWTSSEQTNRHTPAPYHSLQCFLRIFEGGGALSTLTMLPMTWLPQDVAYCAHNGILTIVSLIAVGVISFSHKCWGAASSHTSLKNAPQQSGHPQRPSAADTNSTPGGKTITRPHAAHLCLPSSFSSFHVPVSFIFLTLTVLFVLFF